MNENNIPVTYETSLITSVSPTSNTNDVIDLTVTNDYDECEETSSCSVIVSVNSVNPHQPGRPARNRRRTNSNSSENNPTNSRSESVDDSICILYENIKPPPEVVVVNEVIIDGSEQNQSADTDSISIPDPHPPVIMGSYIDYPVIDFQSIPPLFPEISSERTSSPLQPIDYCMDDHIVTPQHSSLPSCKYATTINERPAGLPEPIRFSRFPLPLTQVPSNVEPVSLNVASHGSELEKSNAVTKVPKIQCGICLDGPDEIAASDRNFTSTNCGHVFCNTCIKTSMKNAAKCPTCRKKITSRSIHPLYL